MPTVTRTSRRKVKLDVDAIRSLELALDSAVMSSTPRSFGTTDTLGRDCTYEPMCPPTHTTGEY